MFKLVKLEERIVLDGAAMVDALDVIHEQDEHEVDAAESAHEAQDGAEGHADDSGFDVEAPLFADSVDGGDSEGVHVLVLSSDVEDGDDLLAAVKDDVTVVRYEMEDGDLGALSDRIEEALGGRSADSIAFAGHTPPASADADGVAFWETIGGMVAEDGRIDLLGCGVVGDDEGEAYVAEIESISGVNVAASIDDTGNEAYGGDWVLESDGVDIQGTYFDAERLQAFDGVLNQDVETAGEVFDQDAEVDTFFAYTIPQGTFNDPNPGPDTNPDTNNGLFFNPTIPPEADWLNFYEPTQVFYGKPTAADEGEAYTITLQASDEDGGFTNAAEVSFQIDVAGVDQLPTYNNPSSIFIDENYPNGPILDNNDDPIFVTGTDPQGGTLTYNLQGEYTDRFAIDSSSGQLSVINGGLLDFETQSRYDLTLVATDPDGWSDTARATIFLNDVEPEEKATVTLDLTNPTFPENGGTTQIIAQLSQPVNETVTVNLEYTGVANWDDGTVTDPDFSGLDIIEIDPNVTESSITLTGLTDSIADNNETFTVTITDVDAVNAVKSTVAADTSVSATITEDAIPEVTLQVGSNDVPEGGTTTVKAVLAGETQSEPLNVYVKYTGTATRDDGAATAPDYTAGEMIEIPAGETEGEISFSALTDAFLTGTDAEGAESAEITIDPMQIDGYVVNDNAARVIQIADIDPNAAKPTVTLAVDRFIINEDSAPNTFLVTANLDTPAQTKTEIFLDFNTGGAKLSDNDFEVTATKITIPANNGQGQVRVTALTDLEVEGDENIIVKVDPNLTVSADIGTPSQQTVTLRDETPPQVVLSADTNLIYEDAGAGSQSVVISASLTDGVLDDDGVVYIALGGTANEGAGADYEVTRDGTDPVTPVDLGGTTVWPILISAGESAGSLVVTANPDGLYDGDVRDTIVATIQDAVGLADSDPPEEQIIEIVDAEADLAPEAGIVVSPASGEFAENGSITVTLQLDGAASVTGEAYLTLSTVDGDPILGSDYTAKIDGTDVSFDANDRWIVPIELGQSETDIILSGITDNLVEGDENFILTLDGLLNAKNSADTADDAVELSLADSTAKPTVTLGVTTTNGDGATFDELDSLGEATFTATITPASGTTIVNDLPFFLRPSGTATPGDDYIAKDADGNTIQTNTDGMYELTFAATETGTTLTLQASDDPIAEDGETVVVDFGAPSKDAYNTAGTAPINLTLQDPEDGDPTGAEITLEVTQPTDGGIAEAGGTGTLSVLLGSQVSGDTLVDLDLSGSEAILGAGDDWTSQTAYEVGDFVVPTNANGHFYEVQSVTGAGAESGDTEPVTWPTDGGTVVDGGITWVDRDSYDYVLRDPDGNFLYDSSGVVEVTVAEATTEAALTIEGREDLWYEGATEEIIAQLTGTPSQGQLASPGSDSVVLNESLDAPVVNIELSKTDIQENGDLAQVKAVLSNRADEPITVNFSFAGGATDPATPDVDFTAPQTSTTIQAGRLSNFVTVQSLTDKILEADESVLATLETASGADVTLGTQTAETLSIIDDDEDGPPQIFLEFDGGGSTASFQEDGGVATVNVIMDRTVGQPVFVDLNFGTDTGAGLADLGDDYTVSVAGGSDVTPGTGNTVTVTFPAGSSQVSYELTGASDDAFEGTEDETLTLSNPAGGAATAPPEIAAEVGEITASITDEDGAPTVNLVSFLPIGSTESFVQEGDFARLTATLSKPAANSITVPLEFTNPNPTDAEPGVDYQTPPSEIVFSAGSTQATLSIKALTDGDFETDEPILVNIGTVSSDTVNVGASDTQSIDIRDEAGLPEVSIDYNTGSEATITESTVTTGQDFRIVLDATDSLTLGDIDVSVQIVATGTEPGIEIRDTDGNVEASTTSGSTFTFTHTFDQSTSAVTNVANFVVASPSDGNVSGDNSAFITISGFSTDLAQDATEDNLSLQVVDADFTAPELDLVFAGIATDTFSEDPNDPLNNNLVNMSIQLSKNDVGATVVLDMISDGADTASQDDFEVVPGDSTNPRGDTNVEVLTDGQLTVNMSAGVTETSFWLRGFNDDLFEGTDGEDFTIALNAADSVNVQDAVDTEAVNLTIVEDDAAPVVTFGTPSPDSVTEGTDPTAGGTSVIPVLMDSAREADTLVNLELIQDGTDPFVDFDDYTLAVQEGQNAPQWSSETTFSEGAYIQVATPDGSVEDYFYVAVEVSDTGGETGATEPAWDTSGATFTDDGVTWAAAGLIEPEVTDGTPGTIADTFELNFPAFETELNLVLTPTGDTFPESNEIALFSVATGANYEVIGAGQTEADTAEVTIVNDDEGPEISLEFAPAGLEVTEGPTGGTLSVIADPTSGANIDVNLAFVADGADFGAGADWDNLDAGTDLSELVTAGDLFIPTTPNEHYYVVESVGTDTGGFSEPTWPTDGGTVGGTDTIVLRDLGTYDYRVVGIDSVEGDGTYQVTIPSGGQLDLPIDLWTDNRFEPDEVFTVSIDDVSSEAKNEVADSLDVTIKNDDALPSFALATGDTDLSETAGNVYDFTVTSSEVVGVDTVVTFRIAPFTGGTNLGASTADFDVVPGNAGTEAGLFSVTFSEGTSQVSISLVGKTDNLYEGDEDFEISIESVNADLDGDGTAGETAGNFTATDTITGTVVEGTDKPEVSVSISPDTFAEADSTDTPDTAENETVVTVSLTGATTTFAQEIPVVFGAAADAEAGTDYEVFLGTDTTETPETIADGGTATVTLSAGATAAVLTLQAVTDTENEGPESVEVSIGTATAASDGWQNDDTTAEPATATLEDSTEAPKVSLSLETFYGGTGTGAEPDTDDNRFLEGALGIFTEADNFEADITITLTNPTFQDVAVPLVFTGTGANAAVLDFDYDVSSTATVTPVAGQTDTLEVTVPTGATEVGVVLTAIDDPETAPVFSGDKGFTVAIGDLDTAGGDGILLDTATDTLTEVSPIIVDNEDAPLVGLRLETPGAAWDGLMDEDGGLVNVIATLDRTTPEDVVVTLDYNPGATDAGNPGQAIFNDDYEANLPTITITAGATQGQANVSLTPLTDGTYEGLEDFVVSVADATNARAAAIGEYDGVGDYETGGDYAFGNILIGTAGEFYKVTTDNGVADNTAYNFPTEVPNFGDTFTDGDIVWTNMGLVDPTSQPFWNGGAEVTAGDTVYVGNGYYYEAVTGGTTGANPPSWATAPGSTVSDGSVSWEVRGNGIALGEVTGTIVDDDAGPEVTSVSASPLTIAESNGVSTINVALSGTSPVDETVFLTYEDLAGAYPAEYGEFNTSGGTGGDFRIWQEATGNTEADFADDFLEGDRFVALTIPAGETAGELYLIAENDSLGDPVTQGVFEPNETVVIDPTQIAVDSAFGQFGVASDAGVTAPTVTIEDDDDAIAPILGLSFDETTDTAAQVATATQTEGGDDLVLNAYVNVLGTDNPVQGEAIATIQVGTAGDAVYGTDFTIAADTDGDGTFTITIPNADTSAAIPITVIGDNVYEGDETFELNLVSAESAKVNTAADSITATIDDQGDEPGVYITLDSTIVDTGEDTWDAGADVTAGDTITLKDGRVFEALTDGTTGATEPDWPVAIGDTVEDGGGAGDGIFWEDQARVWDWATSAGVNDGDVVIADISGESYLFEAVADGTSGGIEPVWSDADAVGETIGDGFGGLSWENIGVVVNGWAADQEYSEGTFLTHGTPNPLGGAASPARYVEALDSGTTGATEPTWPTTSDDVVFDGTGDTPILWELTDSGPVGTGTVDELDVAQFGDYFIITKDNATEEPLTVTWEIETDTATTTAVNGHPDGAVGPLDTQDYEMSATSGTVVLGVNAFGQDGVRVDIPGDQFEEASGDLQIKITEVAFGLGGETQDFILAGGESATLTIEDVDPDGTDTGAPDPDAAPNTAFIDGDGIDETLLTEGEAVAINNLIFTDSDHDPDELIYSVVTGVENGTLFLDANQNDQFDGTDTDQELVAGTTFTQKNLADGDIWYLHGGGSLDALTDSFQFTVADGGEGIGDGTYNVTYANSPLTGTEAGEPWTFNFTAANVEDAPVMDAQVYYAAENADGPVRGDSFLINPGAPIATDEDGSALTFQFEDENGNWVDNGAFEQFEVIENTNGEYLLSVKTGEELDYEVQAQHTLNIRVSDDAAAPFTWDDQAYFAVFVNDQSAAQGDDQFETGVNIQDQTVGSDELFIFPIPSDVFLPADRYSYNEDVTAAELPWLFFSTETQTFIFEPGDPDAPTSDQTFTINVTAEYWFDNALPKGEITKSFDLTFDVASLEDEALMRALDYLDEAEGEGLPQEGEAMEVQAVMMAQAPATAPADEMPEDYAAVLDLLDSEVLPPMEGNAMA